MIQFVVHWIHPLVYNQSIYVSRISFPSGDTDDDTCSLLSLLYMHKSDGGIACFCCFFFKLNCPRKSQNNAKYYAEFGKLQPNNKKPTNPLFLNLILYNWCVMRVYNTLQRYHQVAFSKQKYSYEDSTLQRVMLVESII